LKIRENESASSFIKRFTYAKTTAEAATNIYTDDKLVDFVLAGLRSSKQTVYQTALQLYRLERLHQKQFTLREIEQNFFQLDESIGRDKQQLCTEHAMAAGSTYRGNTRGGRFTHRGWGQGRGNHGRRPQSASAHAVQQHSSITCYKCGAPGHVATHCPFNTGGTTSGSPSTAGSSGQRPRTAPPARGHAAAAQEGGSSSSNSGTTSTTRGTSVSSSHNAMVCMARAVQLEPAMSARRVANYTLHPNQRHPGPQPVPMLEMDHEGAHFLTKDRFVTLIFPLSTGTFNTILEDHIARRIAPAHYGGDLNPLHDGLWLMLYNHPLSEVDRLFAAVTYPNGVEDIVIEEGIIPMLENGFGIPIDTLHNCVARFCFLVQAYLTHCFSHCWQLEHQDAPVTVTARNNTLCITFYPIVHDTPVLVQDGSDMYIVPEHAVPRHMITVHAVPVPNEEEKSDGGTQESSRMAISGPATSFTYAVRKKDPTIEDIGDPCDLGNFLPDSGATQHMTPRRADLFDVVEGQNLGVEVADGHVIQCSITGKIRLSMTDDNGRPLKCSST